MSPKNPKPCEPWRQSTPQPPALNAVGGRVFQRKTRSRARACGTRGVTGPVPERGAGPGRSCIARCNLNNYKPRSSTVVPPRYVFVTANFYSQLLALLSM